MKRKNWVVVLVVVGVLAVALGGGAAFAHEETAPNDEAWEGMHLACENGDYEAMAEWHAQYHGEEGTMSGGMMGGW